jgi:hypothetical protein
MTRFIKMFALCLATFTAANTIAQTNTICATPEGCLLYVQAKAAFNAKSYASAVNLMRLCIREEPTNVVFHRELSRAYLLDNKLNMATYFIDRTMELPTADEGVFSFASDLYSQISQFDLARKALNKGIEKFPHSGMLWEAKGVLYYNFEKDKEALEYWEKGIKEEPTYAGNYYRLAKQEILVNENIVKTIVLAETYLTMEPLGMKADEIKRLLYDAYRQMYGALYSGKDITAALSGKARVSKGSFQYSICKVYENNKYMLVGGISDNNLIMFRMRFLLDWSSRLKDRYPLALINYLQNLVAEGHFEVYNRWIFGQLINEDKYNKWYLENAESYQNFIDYIARYKLTPSNDQYYFK